MATEIPAVHELFIPDMPTALELPDDFPQAEWLELLKHLFTTKNRAHWRIGDALVFGDGRYPNSYGAGKYPWRRGSDGYPLCCFPQYTPSQLAGILSGGGKGFGRARRKWQPLKRNYRFLAAANG